MRAFGAAAVTAAFCFLAFLAKADTDTPKSPTILLFAGTDLWRDGAFLYGGFLWSPASLNTDGFTLKLLLAGGTYVYPSSTLQTDVDGRLLSASALPGWRVTSEGLTVALYAGPIIQDYRLSPNDPASLLRGSYAGAQIATDMWYQPNPGTMAEFNASIASIAAIGTARAAVGWRPYDSFFIGPEAQAFWCVDYQQWRLGVHVTGFRVDGFEWSAATGWAVESDGRTGPYLRLGVNMRY